MPPIYICWLSNLINFLPILIVCFDNIWGVKCNIWKIQFYFCYIEKEKQKKQEAHEGLCSTGMVFWSFSIQCMYVWWISDSKWRLYCVHKLYYSNLTISRAIIQSCMGGSGWFAKVTKLSWISNYCISLIKIQSKLKTVLRSQAIVYRRTDDGHHATA